MRARQLKFLLKIAPLTILLTGCENPIFRIYCPPLIKYSSDFQARAANELATLPKGSNVATLVTDYSKMRDACRAIERK